MPASAMSEPPMSDGGRQAMAGLPSPSTLKLAMPASALTLRSWAGRSR